MRIKGEKGVMGEKFAEVTLKITNSLAGKNKAYGEGGRTPLQSKLLYAFKCKKESSRA